LDLRQKLSLYFLLLVRIASDMTLTLREAEISDV